MKILNLTAQKKVYTSNVYLLTGTWNTLGDLNTLIDVGRDPSILERIENASTGVGKKRIEQVFLTHSHYDHASLLPTIKESYNPKVFAASTSLPEVDAILVGGERVRIADRDFEVILTPGHSSDSICLYCEEERVIFAGDTPLVIITQDSQYEADFIRALEYITRKRVDAIYFGHGDPLLVNCEQVLRNSLMNVLSGR